tara:strand:- start:136 stop:294 length:159 start_codon:yes stop_codon:yes gene_type:complete
LQSELDKLHQKSAAQAPGLDVADDKGDLAPYTSVHLITVFIMSAFIGAFLVN